MTVIEAEYIVWDQVVLAYITENSLFWLRLLTVTIHSLTDAHFCH